jgi:hypothetical protein
MGGRALWIYRAPIKVGRQINADRYLPGPQQSFEFLRRFYGVFEIENLGLAKFRDELA